MKIIKRRVIVESKQIILFCGGIVYFIGPQFKSACKAKELNLTVEVQRKPVAPANERGVIHGKAERLTTLNHDRGKT